MVRCDLLVVLDVRVALGEDRDPVLDPKRRAAIHVGDGGLLDPDDPTRAARPAALRRTGARASATLWRPPGEAVPASVPESLTCGTCRGGWVVRQSALTPARTASELRPTRLRPGGPRPPGLEIDDHQGPAEDRRTQRGVLGRAVRNELRQVAGDQRQISREPAPVR